MKKLVLIHITASMLLMACNASASRLALVVSNQNYSGSGRLATPHKDSELVASSLRKHGFEVVQGKDLDRDGFANFIRTNRSKVAAAEFVVIYYAGHAVQVNGQNHLLPVGLDIRDELDLRYAVTSNDLSQLVQAAKGPGLILLDACRNNPFEQTLTRSIGSSTRGLARISPSSNRNITIGYATEPGNVAQDGTGNSPYAKAIASVFRDGQSDLRLLLGKVKDQVYNSTQGQQTPFLDTSWSGDIVCLSGRCGGYRDSNSPLPNNVGAERYFWQEMKSCGSAECYESYLSKYPNGDYVAAARSGLKKARTPLPNQQVAGLQVQPTRVDRSLPIEIQELQRNMVTIPSGNFMMGSPSGEANRDDDERQHRVSIGKFKLGKFEVTKGQFAQFVSASDYRTDAESGNGCIVWTGSEWKREGDKNWRNVGFRQSEADPVACVSWNDAQAFVKWLNKQAGTGTSPQYRLPTEAEWEYAARAGTETAFSTGNCLSTDQANYNGNHEYGNCGKSGVYRDKTIEVGQFSANEWGLHDMHGNVSEWTCSDYVSSYDGSESRCSSGGVSRSLRGGSWNDGRQALRSAYRNSYLPVNSFNRLGFRLAQDTR